VKDRRFLRRCKSYACYLTDGSLGAESLALDRGLFGLCHHAITPVSSAFFLALIFFGLTAQVISLRSCLRVFCFHGSSPKSMGPSQKADAGLRLHAPSLSLVPQRKRGRKKVKKPCLAAGNER